MKIYIQLEQGILKSQQVQAKSSQVIYQKNYPNQSKAIFQYLYMSQKHG